jgi:hypothetical protein
MRPSRRQFGRHRPLESVKKSGVRQPGPETADSLARDVSNGAAEEDLELVDSVSSRLDSWKTPRGGDDKKLPVIRDRGRTLRPKGLDLSQPTENGVPKAAIE